MNERMLQRIGVIGAGAWGTALAGVARRAGRDVVVWARDPALAETVNRTNENPLYLPGIKLDPAIQATGDLAVAAACDALLLVCPAQALRGVTAALAPYLDSGKLLAICAKGFEQATGKYMSQVLAETCPSAVPAVLSGPSFAQDVARGLPTAVTLACGDKTKGMALAQALNHVTFRPYYSADVLGAQIGGAVKNVLAIACGISEGKRLGASARAALTTRGFSELSRLGLALGAQAETLAGLSGLGDLILTCSSPQSRNMSLGMALGEGRSLDDILGARRSVSEGVYTAGAVIRLADTHGIDMPIAASIHAIVSGGLAIDDAIGQLLSRPLKIED